MATIHLEGSFYRVALDEGSELAVLNAALRATPGSDVPELREHPCLGDHYFLSLDSDSNTVALWATGFEWTHRALLAALDRAIPLLQRRAVLQTLSLSVQSQRRPETAA